MARGLGRADNPPRPLKIQIAPHVSTNFEGIVVKILDDEIPGIDSSLWKITRLMMIRKHGLSQAELTYRLLAHWVKPIGLQEFLTNLSCMT